MPDLKNPTTSTFLYFLNSTECRGKESIRKSSDFALKSLKKFDTKCAKWQKYFLGHRLVANFYSTKIWYFSLSFIEKRSWKEESELFFWFLSWMLNDIWYCCSRTKLQISSFLKIILLIIVSYRFLVCSKKFAKFCWSALNNLKKHFYLRPSKRSIQKCQASQHSLFWMPPYLYVPGVFTPHYSEFTPGHARMLSHILWNMHILGSRLHI